MNKETDNVDILYDYFSVPTSEFVNFEDNYPLIKETVVPLSFTGVNARTFHSWKENGLVDLTILKKTDDSGRVWIKLNLYEYVWIKIIQLMRDFGLSYEMVKIVKEAVEVRMYEQLATQMDVFENVWRQHDQYTEEKIQELKAIMHQNIVEMLSKFDTKDPYEQERTFLFNFIKITLVTKANVSIILVKQKDDFYVDVIYYESSKSLANSNYANIKRPRFEIPIREIVEEFFESPKSEEYGLQLGLFNAKEKRVLDALRKRDFVELNIKLDGEDDFIIEAINDGNISDEQAAQIRKILSLGSYESITLKHRNNKNLYFKKNRRL